MLTPGPADAAVLDWLPWLVLVLSAAGGFALYLRGVARLWESAGRGRGIGWPRLVLAGTGLALTLAIVSPPLEWRMEKTVSGHMVQHLVLIVLAPAAFVLARPRVAFAWGAPHSLRPRAHGRERSPWSSSGVLLTALVVAHAIALVGWHVPRLYDLAVRDDLVHEAEHLTLGLTALAFWWSVMEARRGAIATVHALLATLAVAVAGTAVGVVLAFSQRPFYEAAGGWRLSPLTDQQTAGALMWSAGGLAYAAVAVALVLRLQRLAPAASDAAGAASDLPPPRDSVRAA